MDSYRTISRLEGLLAGLIAALVLIGWIFDLPLLKSVIPEWAPMKPNDIPVILLAATAVWLMNLRAADSLKKRSHLAINACAAAITLIALFTLSEYVFGCDLGIDQVFFRAAGQLQSGFTLFRPSANEALSFLLLGLSLLALDRKNELSSPITLTQALIIPAGLIALLALVGYLLGVQQMHGNPTFSHMAFNAALCVALLAHAILFARPELGVMRLVTSKSTTGSFVRRLLPVVFFLPLILGWIRLNGQSLGLYGTELGVCAMVVALIVVFSLVVYWFGLHLFAEEQKALASEYELFKSRRALEQSVTHLNLALSAARLGTWSIEADSGRMSLDEGARAIFGLPPGPPEHTVNDVLDCIAPAEREAVKESLEDALRLGCDFSAEFRTALPDSGKRFLSAYGSPSAGANTASARLTGIIQDISERKQSQEALEELTERLSLSLEASKTGAWDWYIPEEQLHFDDTCERLFGLVPGTFEGRYETFLHLVHPEDRDYVRQLIAESQDTGSDYNAGFRIVWADGTVHHLSCRGKAYLNSKGEATRMAGVLSDITQHKQAEMEIARLNESLDRQVTTLNSINEELEHTAAELKQARDQAESASRLKSQFLANMSHEIRTPMNGVIGMTNILLKTALNDKQRQFAESIREAAHALLRIINDILDFSKIEAGKLEIELVDCDPVYIVEGVGELLAEPAAAKRLTLMTYVAPDVPARLLSDPTRLRQVLTNLAGNALKFSDSGEISIKATMETDQAKPATVRFSVADTGIGLTEEEKLHLFRPFEQLADARKRKSGGTGLGLAISKRLVELLGGEIGVESTKGQGSTFWFTTPLPRKSLPALANSRQPRLKGTRVLVVSDLKDTLQILSAYISSWGIQAEEATTAQQALTLLHESTGEVPPVAAAIIALSDSEEGSFDLACKILSDKPVTSTKLILISSRQTPESGERAIRTGFKAALSLPVKQSQLLNCLTNVLLGQEAEAAALPAGSAALTGSKPGCPLSERDLSQKVESGPPERSELILIAEDNPLNQQVTRLYLEELGFRSDIAEDGRKALEALLQGTYALVLMDCQMPEMDGFEATLEQRKRESATGKHIPIVAMTANAMQGDREQCIMSGMDDYISKPVELADLQKVLDRFLPPRPQVSPVPEPGRQSVSANFEEPPFDLDRLKQRLPLDQLQMLLPLYKSDTLKTLSKMQDAIANRADKELARLGHYLKGASSVLLASQMRALSRQMEEAGKLADWQSARDTLSNLNSELARLCDFAERELSLKSPESQ